MERKLYYNHRPLKIGYIIDDSISVETIKDLILYNFTRWGGRYYQFFLLNNSSGKQKISRLDLKRMESYDPDIYVCTCEIEKEIKDYIITKFSPLEILDHAQLSIQRGCVNLNGDNIRTNPVSIMPCKNLTLQVGFGFHKLVNFIVDTKLGDDLKDILGLNFGYTENIGGHYKHYLDTVDHEDININSISDLTNFFDNIGHKYYIYQNQLSHAPYNYFGKLNPKADDIYLIIGDSVEDYIMFWNRNIHDSSWKSSFINTFILPISNIGENETILKSFLKFVSQYSRYQNQNSQKPNVVIISHTFSEEELKTITIDGCGVRTESILDIYINADFENHRYVSIDHRKYQSLYDESNIVRLDKEELWNTPMANEIYATDVFLEYKKSDYGLTADGSAQISYLEYNRNNNAIRSIFLNRKVRVNNNRSFSIVFDKSERESFVGREFNDNRFELKVKFPSDSSVISSIMLLPRSGDFYQRNFKDVKQSPEGKKAMAIIKLCKGNYDFLENLLDNEKWRDLLIKYTQIFKKEVIESKIKAILEKNTSSLDLIPEKIYKSCFKTGTKNDKYISLDEIKSETGIGENLEEIEDLVETGILRQGIEFKCPLCGEKYWLSVNDMCEMNTCRGCGKQSRISIDPMRHYAFNSILNGSDAKGTFAVLHSLTKLSSFYSRSFIYGLGIECIDIPANQEIESSIGDCDIVCLRDGLLILVEVKYDRGGFKESDFDNVKKISKKVIPDMIIFASYGKPAPAVKKNLEKWMNSIKGDSEMSGIKMSCEQIESSFKLY